MPDSSVPITAGTGTPIRVLTALGPGVAGQQVMTLADSAGNLLGTNAAPLPAYDPDSVTSGAMTVTDAVVGAPAGAGAILTGTPTAGSTVSWALTGGDATIDLQLTGTFGSGTVWLEASADGGTSWVPLHLKQVGVLQTTITFGTTTAGVYRAAASGWSHVRTRITGATSPSVAVTMRAGAGQSVLILGASLPAGSNTIGTVLLGAGTALAGAVSIGATTRSSTFVTSTTTNTATVAKASAGDLQTMLIANTAASAQYVKLFNATTVTLGTTAAVTDIPVAAGTTITLNLGANGLRMTTGIAYAVTGAAGLTNNTAGAGGVSVALTYV